MNNKTLKQNYEYTVYMTTSEPIKKSVIRQIIIDYSDDTQLHTMGKFKLVDGDRSPEEARLNKKLAFYKAEEKRFREEAAQSFVDLKSAREEIERLKAKCLEYAKNEFDLITSRKPHPTCETCGDINMRDGACTNYCKIHARAPNMDYCSAHTELKGKDHE